MKLVVEYVCRYRLLLVYQPHNAREVLATGMKYPNMRLQVFGVFLSSTPMKLQIRTCIFGYLLPAASKNATLQSRDSQF
jgi:hypothetical protein